MVCAVSGGIEMLDAEECRLFWIRRLHPSGGVCPSCRVAIDGRQAETFRTGGRVHCNSCGRWYGYRTGTPLSGTTLDDRQLFLLVYLASLGCNAQSIATACQVSTDTVDRWLRQFGALQR